MEKEKIQNARRGGRRGGGQKSAEGEEGREEKGKDQDCASRSSRIPTLRGHAEEAVDGDHCDGRKAKKARWPQSHKV